MPATTSAIHAWMNAFVTGLEAELTTAGITDVEVRSGYVGDPGKDTVQLGDVFGAQAWDVIGNLRRHEEFSVEGAIGVKRAGSGEDVIRAVRERAFAILAVVERYLRTDTRVGNVDLVHLTAYRLEQGAHDRARWAELNFEISSRKSLPS